MEWLLIILIYTSRGPAFQMERFATKEDCIFVAKAAEALIASNNNLKYSCERISKAVP